MKVFDSEILRQIRALELKQVRALSDLQVDPTDAEARSHFDGRREAIAELRKSLSSYRHEDGDD